MTLTFLGTGTSGGVPSLGCHCPVCISTNPHDKRLRCAALLETDTTRILIDCGPDIRQQLMPLPFKPLNGVLLTHIHYDHVAGLDDLRPYCKFGDINVYANDKTVKGLQRTMPYCFAEHLYPGVPKLALHEICAHKPFRIGDIDILPIQVMHDKMPILGFRFGNFAYITDMKSISPSETIYLHGIDTLVVNALRWAKPHHSHILVHEAIDFAHSIGAHRTYLTHLTHKIGFHDRANSCLPPDVRFAYDGLQINIGGNGDCSTP